MDFNIELVKELMQSEEQFPVNLEDATVWLGFSRKDKLLRSILKNFEKNKDYILIQKNKWTSKGRLKDEYRLTLICFIALAKMSRSGKVIPILESLGYNYLIPCLQVQTIEFIQRTFSHIYSETQFYVNGYFIDLYFPSIRLAIECDEYHHSFTKIKDEIREQKISQALNCKFIRVEPRNQNFYLAEKLQEIISYIYQ